jgi:hypothetical protein
MKKLLSILTSVFWFGCSAPTSPVAYTAYNMWHERTTMDSINYKKGTIIPAGTPLQAIPRDQYNYIFLEKFEGGRDFAIYFNGNHYPDVDVEKFARRTYVTTLSELYKGLSELEIDAIKRGVLVPGMSKRAVLISYGYPPSHRTPDLKANRWTYWMNRTHQKEICFDKDERTIRCEQMEDQTL